MNEYDMNEMIRACEAKQRPDEDIVFAFGVGRMLPKLGMGKAMKKAFNLIKEQEGFIGVHPVDLWHNLLVFDTLNHAKTAMNNLKAAKINTGKIAPILVEKQYIQQGGSK